MCTDNGPETKPVAWLSGEVRTPPFSVEARAEAGRLLRRVQEGESVGMPHSWPRPSCGARVHVLRVRYVMANWRLVYRTDAAAVLFVAVFQNTTRQTPKSVIDACKTRLRSYDE